MAENTVSIRLRLAIREFLADSGKARAGYSNDVQKMASVSKTESGKIRQAMNNLGVRPVSEINREIKKLEVSYERLRRSGTLAPRDLARAQERLKQRTRELTSETGGWAKSLGDAKLQIAGTIASGALLTGFLLRGKREYEKYGDKIAEVNTLLRANAAEIKAVSDRVRRLSVETGTGAGNNAQALYDIISAGATSAADANFVLEQSIKAGIAGVTDTQTAARVGLGVINAYGKQIKDITQVNDVLFTTVRLGVTTFEELSQNLGNVLPVAVTAGVGLDEVTAAIAELTKAGIRTPIAITALRAAINALAAPTPEAARALAEYGIEWRGFTQTIGDFAALNLGPAELRRLIPEVEASNAVSTLARNFDGLVQSIEATRNPSGAIEAAYETMRDAPGQATRDFNAALQELNLQIGEMVASGRPLVEIMTSLVRGLSELNPVSKSVLGTFAAAAIGTVAWSLGLSKLVGALGGALRASGALRGFLAAGVFTFAIAEVVQLVALMREHADAQERLRRNELSRLEVLKKTLEANRANAEVEALSAEQLQSFTEDEFNAYRDRLEAGRRFWSARFQLAVTEGRNHSDPVLREANREARVFAARVSAFDIFLAQRRGKNDELIADESRLRERLAVIGKQIEQSLKGQISASEQRAKAIRDDIRDIERDEARLADRIAEIAERRADRARSLEDQIREINRRGLSEARQRADVESQIAEKIADARRALRDGDLDLAGKLARGTDPLVSRLDNARREVAVLREIERIRQEIDDQETAGVTGQLDAKKAAAEARKTDLRNEIALTKTLKKELQSLPDAEPEVTLEGVQESLSEINRIRARLRDLDKQIARPKVEINTVQQRRFGGPVFAQSGRQIPGYGGGDRVPVLAEAGEWIVNKERSRLFGGLLAAINGAPLDELRKLLPRFRDGGQVFSPYFQVPSLQRFADGGTVAASTPGGTMRLELTFGGREFDLFGAPDQVRNLVDALEQERLGG